MCLQVVVCNHTNTMNGIFDGCNRSVTAVGVTKVLETVRKYLNARASP
jgi:hypothetical protein